MALFIYFGNGLLAVVYWTVEHLAVLALLPAAVLLIRSARGDQRAWAWAAAGLMTAATIFTPAPVPFLMPAMAWAGLGAVRLERFAPDRLRWRALAALGFYAGAALAVTLYSWYADSQSAAAWAASFTTGEAGELFAAGRPYLATLSAIALWVGLPGAYFGLLLQSLLAHPPARSGPAQLTHAIRAGTSERRP